MTYTPEYILNDTEPLDNIFQVTSKVNTNLEDISTELGSLDGRMDAMEGEYNQYTIFSIPFNESSTSPLTIGTQPANSIIERIIVDVTVAASAGSPTISIGTVADADAYTETIDTNLKVVGRYDLACDYVVVPETAIKATIVVASAPSFEGNITVFIITNYNS